MEIAAPSPTGAQSFNFKAPEGKYYLHGDKTFGIVPFNYQCSTKLTIASVPEGTFVLYNVGEFVYYFKHRDDNMRKARQRNKPGSDACTHHRCAQPGCTSEVGSVCINNPPAC